MTEYPNHLCPRNLPDDAGIVAWKCQRCHRWIPEARSGGPCYGPPDLAEAS